METKRPIVNSTNVSFKFAFYSFPKRPDEVTEEDWKTVVEKLNFHLRPVQWVTFGIFMVCAISERWLAYWQIDRYTGQPFSREIGLAMLNHFILEAIMLMATSAIGSRVLHPSMYKKVKKAVREIETLNPSCQVTIWTEPPKVSLYADQIFMSVESIKSHDYLEANF